MNKNYLFIQSRKILGLFCLAMMLTVVGHAQQVGQVSGKVVSADDAEPLPGVSILVKGTSKGTVTNMEGEFSLQADAGEVLTASFIGFETLEIPVSAGQTVYDITMQASLGDLGEVVVVGYGSQRRADITSAVSVINMDNIGDVPTTNVTRLLQGQAAGVQVRQTSGRPGQEWR